MKLRLVLAATALLAVAGCESSSEKAASFYQSALALIEAGDLDRGVVELRNVFTYDGQHYDARKLLAETLAKKGDTRGAYAQYLRLAEQYPEDAAARRELARIAIDQAQWDEAERHGRSAIELEPANPENADLMLALDYRKAVLDEDTAARDAVAAQAQARVDEQPGNIMARRVLVAEALADETPENALDDLDALIVAEPDNLEYSLLKLQILAQREDRTEATAYLDDLVARFPDNRDVQMTAVGWLIQGGDIDKAEERLRQIAGPEDGPTEHHLSLIKFVELHRGNEAAAAEARRLADANTANPENRALYQSLEAYYLFNLGQADQAMTLVETALADAQPSDQTNRLRSMLAGMRLTTGDRAGAEALMQEVLTADPNNVYALRLKAQLEMDDDRPGDAINSLRQALGQNPRDTETLLLLADAYSRAGNRELTGETLASAVDISNRGVSESLRYSDFLMSQNRSAARAVITDALQVNPQNIDLLLRQGQLALDDETYPQVEEVIATLGAIENDERAAAAAETLRGALMLRQGKMDEGLAVLQERAAAGGDAAAVLSVVRAQVVAGRIEEARRYLDSLLADTPDNADLRLIDAGLALTENNPQRSEEILRGLIADDPQMVQPYELLYRQLSAAGRGADATAILDQGLAANPGARPLLLVRAAEHEAAGEIDRAIEIYQQLYSADSGDVVVANNLASMLATWRDDPESLARAAAVALRLKDTQVPPFQDTYGWIAYRNGNAEEALTYLEPAAQALSNDPLVQYHLGMTLAKLGRTDAAREALTRAVRLAEGRDLPQMAEAQATLDSLGGPSATAEGGPGAGAAPADTAPEPTAPRPAASGSAEATGGGPAAGAAATEDGADTATDANGAAPAPAPAPAANPLVPSPMPVEEAPPPEALPTVPAPDVEPAGN